MFKTAFQFKVKLENQFNSFLILFLLMERNAIASRPLGIRDMTIRNATKKIRHGTKKNVKQKKHNECRSVIFGK